MASNNLEYILRLKDMFSKTMQGAVKETKTMDGAMSKLKSGLGSLGGMVTAAFSVGAVVNFGKAVIDSLKNYEYFHASLKTLLQGNENATKALENQLVSLAKTTPFELTEVQDGTKKLMAYGFQAGEVVNTMRTLGDVSSGVGAPLGDIVYLYGTLRASNRVTMMDIRQFAGRGIPIYEALSKRLKITTGQVNEFASAGKIAFKDVEGAFKDMTKEGGQFFNLMDAQSKTVGGRLSNLGDAWEQLKVNIGKSQKGIIASTVNMVESLVSSLNDFMAASNRMEAAFAKFGGKGESFMDKIQKYSRYITGGSKDATVLENYDIMLQSILQSEASNKDKVLALSKKFASLYAMYQTKQIDTDQFINMSSMLRGAINEQRGLSDLNKLKVSDSVKQGGMEGSLESKSSTLGSGTEVSGKRPQSINITIDKLVNELSVQTTNLTEGTAKIKEMVSKALLESVNDINTMATA